MATLRNFANNCYINSIIQMLRNVPGFCESLELLCRTLQGTDAIKGTWEKPVDNILAADDDLRTAVVIELSCLLADMKKCDAQLAADISVGPITPRRFIEALQKIIPKIDLSEQQDAVEILKVILDAIDAVLAKRFQGIIVFKATLSASDINTNGTMVFTFKLSGGIKQDAAQSTRKTFVQEVFWGVSAWRTKCSACLSDTSQDFKLMEILVPISCGEPKLPVTMDKLISAVVEPEKIVCECADCKHHVEIERSFQFKDLPQVLMINFGRFKLDIESGKTVKTFDKVRIPEVLDCFCNSCRTTSKASHQRYSLIGMVVHTGFDLHSGHYMSYCRMESGGWRRFNDVNCSVVSKMEVSHILQKAAFEIPYLLVYSR